MNKNLRIQAGGQVVLMVLLASTLILTLGLSAARRATVETSIDTDQELLKKAFNAAESGIEYYIKTGDKDFSNADSFEGVSNLTVGPLGNESTLSYNKKTGPEDTQFFWLVNHETNGDIGNTYYSASDNTIDICSDDISAVVNFKVDYFYKSGVDYKVQRGNGTNPIVSTNGNTVPNNCVSFSLNGNSVLLAITPMGVTTKISIKGGVDFPSQGEKISAIGSVGKVNNLVTIDHPYDLYNKFLLEAVVSESVVTN